MPIPTVITDLSATAASNYPAGSDAPSALDDVQRAQGAFIRQLLNATQSQAYTAFTTGGTTTAYTLTPSPALTALAAGQRFNVQFNAANTAATATLAISGLTAKSLKIYSPVGDKIDPGIGGLALNSISDVIYDGTDYVVITPHGRGAVTLGTAVASTSGTSIDFTGIPAGAKRITVMLNGVSTNGTSNILVQLGDSGGVETSGYTSRSADVSAQATSTAGFLLTRALGAATDTQFGQAIISLIDSATNTWVQTANINDVGQNAVIYSAGAKALTATLDRVRVTTVNGTDTFDAGTVNISWE